MGHPEQVILNLSGVYVQMGLPEALPAARTIDLTALEGTNCYCSADAGQQLSEVAASVPLRAVHFIDSGDYHYVSRFFLEGIGEPFALLLLDRHPDMQEPAFGGVLSCGSWVRDALDSLPNLRQVVMAGIEPALESETEGYGPGRVLIARGAQLPVPDPSLPVYVSFDKDCLSRDFARTNWDQGAMTLDEAEALLRPVLRGRRLLGVDICGELTEEKGGTTSDMEMNLRTDLHLLSFFAEMTKN